MIVSNELKDTILRDNIVTFDNLFHGFVIIIDGNKVWKNDNGVFLFSTRTKAMSAFYNCMKWKCAREAGRALDSGSRRHDNSTATWTSFKRAAHFEIREI